MPIDKTIDGVIEVLEEEINQLKISLKELGDKKYLIDFKGTPTNFSVADYVLEARGATVFLLPIDKAGVSISSGIPFNLESFLNIGYMVSIETLRDFTIDLNLYLRLNEAHKIRKNEVNKIMQTFSNLPSISSKTENISIDLISSIARRQKKESEAKIGFRNLVFDYFSYLKKLNEYYSEWKRLCDMSFSLNFPSLNQNIQLNLSFFKIAGKIKYSYEGDYYRVKNQTFTIKLIPFNGGNYYIPLDRKILNERGIEIIGIEGICSRLREIKTLEEKIKINEIRCLKKRLQLFEDYGILVPNMSPLLFYKSPLCKDLDLETEILTSHSYGTYKVESSKSYQDIKDPSLIERAIAYGCFGGAVQAGKRAIKSDRFIDSAKNAIIGGLLLEAGFRFMGGRNR